MNVLAHLMVIAGFVSIAFSPTPAQAAVVNVGFAGGVTAVNVSGNSFFAEVRAVYAWSGSLGSGLVLPKGRVIEVVIPSGTVMTNFRGAPMTLANVQVGVLFNAAGVIDTVTRTMTASKVSFGTRIAAPPTPPPSASNLSLSASPSAITAGQSSILTWSSANVTTCTASGGWTGIKALLGTELVSPTVTTTYTLTCDGTAGSVTKSATVSIGSPQVPPPSKGTVNFAGKVVSVDANTRVAVVTVRAVYGISAGGIRGGFLLPVGTQITVTVPAGIPVTRLGVPITLADVKAGDIFNARAVIDRAAKTGVASSIQVLTPGIAENIFSGTLTAFSAVAPTSVTVKSQAGTEQVFSVTVTTQVYIGKTLGTLDQLIVGRSVAVAFVSVSGVKQAAKIVMATAQLQVQLEKFFSVESIQRRGTHIVNLLGASLDRFDKIIAKQETLISDLKAAGKDTAAAEASLAQSKTDLAATRAATDIARAKFAAISSSPDPQAAAKEAQAAMKTAVEATKKVIQDIKNTQQQINLLSL